MNSSYPPLCLPSKRGGRSPPLIKGCTLKAYKIFLFTLSLSFTLTFTLFLYFLYFLYFGKHLKFFGKNKDIFWYYQKLYENVCKNVCKILEVKCRLHWWCLLLNLFIFITLQRYKQIAFCIVGFLVNI